MKGQLFHRVRRVLGVSGPETRATWAKGALALGAAALGLAALLPVQAYSRPYRTVPKHAAAKRAKPVRKHAAKKGAKQEPAVTVIRRMKVLLNLNGDKIELSTTDLTPDTPVTVNGEEGKFGDLTAQQQKQLQEAVKTIAVGVGQRVTSNMERGGNSKSVSLSVHNGATSVALNLNGNKIELTTTDLKPDTPVTVNGKEGKFGDLTLQQQQEIREAMSLVHASVSLDGSHTSGDASASATTEVSGSIEEAMEVIRGLHLPPDIEKEVLDKLDEEPTDDDGSEGPVF